MTLIIIFICSLIAFLLSAICGGGASLILMPVLGTILPVAQLPAALSIGTFSSSASRLWMFFKQVRFTMVLYFVPPAIVAVFIGAFLLKYLNPLFLQVVMGLFLISNLPLLFKNTESQSRSVKPVSKLKLISIGFLTGFLSGLTGAVGLLFNRFYLNCGLINQEIIATRAANEIILHLIKFVLYGLLGLITKDVLLLGAVVALAAVSSSFLIKSILPFITASAFKKIGYAAMVVSGVMMLVQSGKTILIETNGNISYNVVSEGIETKLQWQQADYTLEFTYNEGFEFEQVISFNELPIEYHQKVELNKTNADNYLIEKVYTMEGVSYEAYYFKNKQLVKKIELD